MTHFCSWTEAMLALLGIEPLCPCRPPLSLITLLPINVITVRLVFPKTKRIVEQLSVILYL
jgi:hypothetical protein